MVISLQSWHGSSINSSSSTQLIVNPGHFLSDSSLEGMLIFIHTDSCTVRNAPAYSTFTSKQQNPYLHAVCGKNETADESDK